MINKKILILFLFILLIPIHSGAQTSMDYTNNGLAKLKKRDTKGALEDFNKALELNPDNANALYFRANIKASNEDYEEAIEDYNLVVKLNPEYNLVYIKRGMCKYKLGDKKAACADFTKSKEMRDSGADKLAERACK